MSVEDLFVTISTVQVCMLCWSAYLIQYLDTAQVGKSAAPRADTFGHCIDRLHGE